MFLGKAILTGITVTENKEEEKNIGGTLLEERGKKRGGGVKSRYSTLVFAVMLSTYGHFLYY